MQTVMIPMTLITVNPEYQNLFPPLSDSEFESLRTDIARVGILQALNVERNPSKTDRHYVVLSGHHRLKVAIELGIQELPCSIISTVEEKISALFDNVHRRQLAQNVRDRLLKEERKLRDAAFSRLIPGLQDIIHLLPHEVRLRVTQMTEEEQDEYLRKFVAGAELIKGRRGRLLETRGPQTDVTVTRALATPGGETAAVTELQQRLKDVEDSKKQELQQAHIAQVQLSQKLKDANSESERLRDEIESLRHQVKNGEAEAKAAQLYADEKLRQRGTPNEPSSPDALLNGLDCAHRLIQGLTAFALKIPLLSSRHQEAARKHLSGISKAIAQIEDSFDPHHDGHVNGKGTKKGDSDGEKRPLQLVGLPATGNGSRPAVR